MLQALVMAIAVRICSEVAIRDLDDYTLVFLFQKEEGANNFIAELDAFDGVSLVRSELSVVVTFAID
jgi:hypothetical protein